MRKEFKCKYVSQFVDAEQVSLELANQQGDQHYFGMNQLQMVITKPADRGFFKPGNSYHIDITEVDPNQLKATGGEGV